MNSQRSLDDFVPFRYQFQTRSITTTIGDIVIARGDQKRVNLKVFPILPIAIANANYFFGEISPTAFRIPMGAGSELELNWYDDNILVCQPVFIRDNTGGNVFTIAEITMIPSFEEQSNDTKRRLAIVYAKVENAKKHGRWNNNRSIDHNHTR